MQTLRATLNSLGYATQGKEDSFTDKTVPVQSIDDLKRLMSFIEVKPGIPSYSERKGGKLSMEEKAYDYVFFNRDLDAKEEEEVKNAFPLEVRCITGNLTLKPGEAYDLGKSTVICADLGVLTMGSGSSLQLSNSVLTMAVALIEIEEGTIPGPGYDLGIFGLTGPPVPQADQGEEGPVGKTGSTPSWGSGKNGGDGEKGGTGKEGKEGKTGNAGLASLDAIINIGTGGITGSKPHFVIHSSSGQGGQGGQGGKGGTGGRGGNGGDGTAASDCYKGTKGGDAGPGGDGGTGGRGGEGGNGTNGAPIYVNVPKYDSERIRTHYTIVEAGQGGPGGPGGEPNVCGTGGSGGQNLDCPKGDNGSSNTGQGTLGNPGNPGDPGKLQGAPGPIEVVPYEAKRSK